MAASSGDAHPYPIYNARYRVVFPILDADGDLVTGAASLDSELSQNQGAFADATNEATELATSSGMYYLDLIAGELDTKSTAIIVKTSTSGAKTTPMVLYPKRLPALRTGTAQAGAATTITLNSEASAIDDFYNGLIVNITNNSPANAQGQARVITDYVGSTKVATVEAAWGTNPSSASTFEILVPEGQDIKGWAGAAVLDPNTGGEPRVRVNSMADDTVTAATIATDAIGSSEFSQAAADKVWSSATRTLTAFSTSLAVSVWDVLESAISVASSIGVKVKRLTFNGSDEVAAAINNAAALAQAAADKIIQAASGTADSGSTTTIVDAERTEADTDYWKDSWVLITSGLVAGQIRKITAFNPSTDTLTVDPAFTQAIGTNTYLILRTAGVPAAGAGATDWTSGEREQIRHRLGIDGTMTAPAVTSHPSLGTLANGTADSGSTTTLVDAARTEADTDYWKGTWLLFVSGSLAGQVRLITAFNAGTDTITFAPATTQAVGTHEYEIIPAGAVDVRLWNGSAPNGLISGRVDVDLQRWLSTTPNALISGRLDVDLQRWLSATPNTLISGRVDANAQVVGDKTGYSLTTAEEDAIVDKVWDELRSGHVVAGSFGEAIRNLIESAVVRRNTAAAGAAGSITLDAGASASDDFYNDQVVVLVGGTGAGQARLVSDYVGSTQLASVTPNWITNPDGTTIFALLPKGRVDLALWLGVAVNALISGRVDANAQVVGDKTGYSLVANAVDAAQFTQAAADKVWTSTTRTLTAFSTGLAVAVWDVLESNITTASSIGVKVKRLTFNGADEVAAAINNAAAFAQTAADKVWTSATRTLTSLGGSLVQEIWDRATSLLTTAGSIGKLIVDNLNATISSVKAQTDQLAFTSGRVHSDMKAVDGSTTEATQLKRALQVEFAGSVTGSATVNGFADSTLTQADTDFWTKRFVIFLTGSQKYQAREITAFTPATDLITVTPAFTTAPAVSDQYIIV